MNYIDSKGEEITLSLFDNGVLILRGNDYALKFNPKD